MIPLFYNIFCVSEHTLLEGSAHTAEEKVDSPATGYGHKSVYRNTQGERKMYILEEIEMRAGFLQRRSISAAGLAPRSIRLFIIDDVTERQQ